MVKISLDKEESARVNRTLKDIPKSISEFADFIFRPGKYFSSVLKLKTEKIAKKLAVYYLIIESLALCLIILVERSLSYAFHTVVGSIVFDVLSSIPFIVILAFSLHLARIGQAIEKAAVFFLTLKIVFGLIPIFFFVSFISSENYVFAVMRALAIYGIIVYSVVGAAVIFSRTIFQRAIIIGLSSLLILTFSISFSFLSVQLNTSLIQPGKYSPLYDPIADEFLEANQRYGDEILKIDYDSYMDNIKPFNTRLFDYDGYYRLRREWNELSSKYLELINKYIDKINKEEFRFEINKDIFQDSLKTYLLSLQEVDSKTILSLSRHPGTEEFYEKQTDAIKSIVAATKASNDYLNRTVSYLKLIVKLSNWGVITTSN